MIIEADNDLSATPCIGQTGLVWLQHTNIVIILESSTLVGKLKAEAVAKVKRKKKEIRE